MPLSELLRSDAREDGPALIFEDAIYTRGQLGAQVEDLAGRLQRTGVWPGSKVLLALPNTPAFIQSLLAINECGAVVMPVNPNLGRDERLQIEGISRPDFTLAVEGDQEMLHGVHLSRVQQRDDADTVGDTAAIIFTSGTTGTPKGVMLSEAALVSNARAVAAYLRLSETDLALVFLPLSYAYALSQVLSTLTAGGTIVLLQTLRYPKLAFQAIADHGVTGFGGVPTSLAILSRHQAATRAQVESLRYILSAGGPLAPALLHDIQESFPGVAVFNNYGCTEIGPRATALECTARPDKAGSIGRAIPGVRVTIVRTDFSIADVGEIGEMVLDGPSLMKGYYRDPKTTSARMSRHGFHTGDYAYADAEGFFFYQGREDDIFKSAGEKVSAKEVEDVVLAHQDIAEAAVVSRPDSLLGAVPVLYVVLRPGHFCTDRDLQTFCARRLARHKVPRTVHFVDELRKTGTGKIQKQWLRQISQ